MKYLVLASILSLATILGAQTGPGGVGTSAANVLWLAANRGVTLNGTTVSGWADQSGNTNNASAPTVAAQPTFSASDVNGYPSFTYDGADDQLWVTDHNSLDLTQWHIFIVVKPNLQKNFNAWLTKGDDNQENYELLSYVTGNIHSPVRFTDTGRDAVNTAANTVTTAGYEIIEYKYIPAAGRDIYKNNTHIGTDNQYRTPLTNVHPLYIGNEKNVLGRFVNGAIAEVIIYNAPLNETQKTVVNNYLAAKYDKVLGVNDLYTMDNAANGNFDHDVAGIGQLNASDNQLDARGSGIVRMRNATNLGDNEYYIWGHNNLTSQANNLADVPAGVEARFDRIWRGSEVNAAGAAVDIGAVDVEFDLTGLGSVVVTDLRLLVDVNNNGIFSDDTPIAGAIAVGGNIYRFSGVSSLANEIRFTIGTVMTATTPLPVELVSFDAEKNGRKVKTHWEVSFEEDLDHYEIHRTTDFDSWEFVGMVQAVGQTHYELVDETPLDGISYYRLQSVDDDHSISELGIRSVEFENDPEELSVYPNPSDELFIVSLDKDDFDHFRITDQSGRDITGFLEMQWMSDNQLLVKTNGLASGVYYLSSATSSARLVVL